MYFDKSYGCPIAMNDSPKSKNNKNGVYEIDNTIYLAPEIEPADKGCNDWTRPADINTYLNGEYFATLQDNSKVDNHLWNVGALSQNSGQTLETDVAQEKSKTWKGYIGLINPSDYVKASTDTSCTSVYSSDTCKNNNYLYTKADHNIWTITAKSESSISVLSIADKVFASKYPFYYYYNPPYYVYPVLYLNTNGTLSGNGTADLPFQIVTQ